MKKTVLRICSSLGMGLLMLSPAWAQSSTEGEMLIRSCKELTKIYDDHGERRFAAGLRTSVSDSFRAGYCKGSIDAYRSNDNRCRTRNWRTQAQGIANQSAANGKAYSANQLLAWSCDY